MSASTSNIPNANGDRHEFAFTQADFRQIARLIFDHAGISLSPAKSEMVYNRLSRRLRVLSLPSFAAYLELLGRGDETEWSAFVGALTTHMTSFFREEHHFPILATYLCTLRSQGVIRLWCSAASTGEEAYSMAITAAETFDSLTPPVTILASDVDREVLQEAREGIYPRERVQHLPERMLKRYFEWGSGTRSGSVRVRPELKRLITFQPLNLIDPVWPMKEPFDAIFCRNVMIYFERSTQKEILLRSHRHLKPGGLYFAGHSENLSFAEHLFLPCGKTVYLQQAARPGGTTAQAAARPA